MPGPSVVNSWSSTSNGFAISPVSGDLLFISVTAQGPSPSITGVTIGSGGSATQIDYQTDSLAMAAWTGWFVVTSGSTLVTINGSNLNTVAANVYDISGANTSAPIDVHNMAAISSGSIGSGTTVPVDSGTVSPIQSNDLLFVCGFSYSSTPTGAYIESISDNNANSLTTNDAATTTDAQNFSGYASYSGTSSDYAIADFYHINPHGIPSTYRGTASIVFIQAQTNVVQSLTATLQPKAQLQEQLILPKSQTAISQFVTSLKTTHTTTRTLTNTNLASANTLSRAVSSIRTLTNTNLLVDILSGSAIVYAPAKLAHTTTIATSAALAAGTFTFPLTAATTPGNVMIVCATAFCIRNSNIYITR